MKDAHGRPNKVSFVLPTSNRYIHLPEEHYPSNDVPTPVIEYESVPQKPRAPKQQIWIRGGSLSVEVPVRLTTLDTKETSKEIALLDSGATHSFIDEEFVKMKGWNMERLQREIVVRNVDGTTNSAGSITHSITVRLTYEEQHSEKITLGVTKLGRTTMILGHDWLKLHNPSIDWTTGKIALSRCPPSCKRSQKQLKQWLGRVEEDEAEEDVHISMIHEGDNNVSAEEGDRIFACWIRASETISQRLHQEAMRSKSPEEEMHAANLIPKEFQEFKAAAGLCIVSSQHVPDRSRLSVGKAASRGDVMAPIASCR